MKMLILAAALSVAPPESSLPWQQLEPGRDQTCGFTRTFDDPGHTTIIVGENRDHRDREIILMAVSNSNWNRATFETKPPPSVWRSHHVLSPSAVTITDDGFVLTLDYAELSLFASGLDDNATVQSGSSAKQLDFRGFYGSWLVFAGCRARNMTSEQ